MSGLTVRLYEEYLAGVYNNRKTDQGLFIKLVEEIGEVAEQISIRDGRKMGILRKYKLNLQRTSRCHPLYDCDCRCKRH